ncbi:response regulator [Vibrio splendidus]|uniref:response regulator n=1 Tax=Vibrio splendidus TaxID=29497 RepID=UPI00148C1331|nr:response regulator [Vibrio splendidus]NOJ07476.1 response regulator [Vibrio splendidus]
MMFNQLKVLVVDDAPIVLSTIRNMLIHIGFSEKYIYIASSPKVAISLVNETPFHVIICDYNFGVGMNGKQLFEELKQTQKLKDDGVFILVTGENSALSIRPIIELRPDNYLLKPFNRETLKLRIMASIRKKKALEEIYKADREHLYRDGLDHCEALSHFHPEYFSTIEQFKGRFLSKLKLFDAAKVVYESMIIRGNFDWAQAGLANSLANLGQLTKANQIISTLIENAPSNTLYRDEAAQVSLISNRIPAAIAHFKLASKLTPGNSDRELAIANLCLSVNDSETALRHYQNYIHFNKETFRDNVSMKLNHIRFLLYSVSDDIKKQEKLEQVNSILSKVKKELTPEIDCDLALIDAHMYFDKKEYKKSIDILSDLHDSNPFTDFSTIYHHAWLLDKMSGEREFGITIQRIGILIVRSESSVIISSQMTMLNELKSHNERKLQWLKAQNIVLEDTQSSHKALLTTYLNIQKRAPLIKKVCMNIVKLLTLAWPSSLGSQQVNAIISECNDIIQQLYTTQELQDMQYSRIYDKAKSMCANIRNTTNTYR